jgi:hypothetical protein
VVGDPHRADRGSLICPVAQKMGCPNTW